MNSRDSQTTREHPQSFGVVDIDVRAPKDHALDIKPYLDEESELEKNIHFLLGVQESFNEATSCSKDALVKPVAWPLIHGVPHLFEH